MSQLDAKFALDPGYLRIEGEDTNGFRAIAQRSKLSDAGKDSGEVSMFPNLAEQMVDGSASPKKLAEFQQERLPSLKERLRRELGGLAKCCKLRLSLPISERSHYGLPSRLTSSFLSLRAYHSAHCT